MVACQNVNPACGGLINKVLRFYDSDAPEKRLAFNAAAALFGSRYSRPHNKHL